MVYSAGSWTGFIPTPSPVLDIVTESVAVEIGTGGALKRNHFFLKAKCRVKSWHFQLWPCAWIYNNESAERYDSSFALACIWKVWRFFQHFNINQCMTLMVSHNFWSGPIFYVLSRTMWAGFQPMRMHFIGHVSRSSTNEESCRLEHGSKISTNERCCYLYVTFLIGSNFGHMIWGSTLMIGPDFLLDTFWHISNDCFEMRILTPSSPKLS